MASSERASGETLPGASVKILIVEDDLVVQELLDAGLSTAGYVVLRAADPVRALQLFREEQPDLAILDVNLGPWNGFELLRDLRRVSPMPVIMLTGRGAEEDVLRGFELGANDYMLKPFHYRELLARIRSHLHDSATGPGLSGEDVVLQAGCLELDPGKYSVTCSGQPLHLTPTEFRLLHTLMRRAGLVVPNRWLLKEAWGYEDQSTEVIRATVHRLRRKLARAAPGQGLIRTLPGIGLILEPSPG